MKFEDVGRGAGEMSLSGHERVRAWVSDVSLLTSPERIVLCDGSQAEYKFLCEELRSKGALRKLNPAKRPNSFLAISDPSDVSGEVSEFVCTSDAKDAGPLSRWRPPDAMRAALASDPIVNFSGCMKGRTLYVVPFSMGPLGSHISQIGVQITDSPYVVITMHLMARIGKAALEELSTEGQFVRCVHTVGAPLAAGQQDVPWPCNQTKFIAHFPENMEVWSYGSGHGSNAMLAQRHSVLTGKVSWRIGSRHHRLAERMRILGLTNPGGKKFHIAVVLPSASGRTNFSSWVPPKSIQDEYTVTTIGDDVAWIKLGRDGRLRAISPDAGYFGFVGDANPSTGPRLLNSLKRDALFTNVALTEDGDVWWEGLTETPPTRLIDWRGCNWTPEHAELCSAADDQPRFAADPHAYFTIPAINNTELDAQWDEPDGVIIDALIFVGHRSSTTPFVTDMADLVEGVKMAIAMGASASADLPDVNGLQPHAILADRANSLYHYWLHFGLQIRDQGMEPASVYYAGQIQSEKLREVLWPDHRESMLVLEYVARQLESKYLRDPRNVRDRRRLYLREHSQSNRIEDSDPQTPANDYREFISATYSSRFASPEDSYFVSNIPDWIERRLACDIIRLQVSFVALNEIAGEIERFFLYQPAQPIELPRWSIRAEVQAEDLQCIAIYRSGEIRTIGSVLFDTSEVAPSLLPFHLWCLLDPNYTTIDYRDSFKVANTLYLAVIFSMSEGAS